MSRLAAAYIVRCELKAGAKLWKRPQITGGDAWELLDARVKPASLGEVAEYMLEEGYLMQLDKRADGSVQYTLAEWVF